MRSAERVAIAPRLAVSFAAVVILAVAANMIARETVVVIRTLTRGAETPPVATPLTTAPAALAVTSTPVAMPPVAVPRVVNSGHLTSAVELYEQASRARAENNSATTRFGYLAAQESLQRAALDFKNALPRTSEAQPAIARHTSDYLDRGRALVDLADERRSADVEYLHNTNAIAEDIQKSLDHAWKIFGRVIARQSLIDMRANIDLIRQHADSLLRDGNVTDNGGDAVLTADELAISRQIEANNLSLVRSQGADWVKSVSEHVHILTTLRKSIESMDLQYTQAGSEFVQRRKRLTADIFATASSREIVAPRATAAGAFARAPPVPVQLASDNMTRPGVTKTSSITTAGVTTPSITTPGVTTPMNDVQAVSNERTDQSAPRLMAIVTAVVMFVICLISVLTVRSIVIPVRRLVKAAGQLAGGEPNVAVRRGGIRELDQLTGAFNEMASQIQAYHLERTRKLQRMSQQDALTSLPNRGQLNVLLNAALARAAREDRYVGVYFLDIDNFKNINDTLGHAFGDRVLMSVANRLEELIEGLGFIARLGGDEFTIVYEDAPSLAVIHEFGVAVSREFQKLLSVDDRELSVGVSLGASIFPVHESDADGLLRAADSALFRAKELGRSQLVVFTPELITSAASRFSIEQGLRRAIEHSEFELAYQPEINLATGETEILEALLRWRMPDGRVAKPGEFLSIAEQSGLMTEINSWVLRTAVADASRWHLGGWPDVRVAINISPRQLLDQRFVENILSLLQEFGLPARCIELELTEMAFQTGPATVTALRILRSHGFGIALDDFGTGYSSLTSLEQLPLSRIKLDRSLINGIDTSPRAAAIVRAIMDLCGGLQLQVTAEGIERAEQFNWFLANRCILLQGYLFSEAVPFADVLGLRAGLVHKISDLLLSAPPLASPRDSRAAASPHEAQSSTARHAAG
ncbi:MAG: EAL domain-containing protein [Gammaproteobacteria bacterium]